MAEFVDDFGTKLFNVHEENRCMGEWCPIHKQSNHHMFLDPQKWNQELQVMQRICQHNQPHPDPDDAFSIASGHSQCDGCCKKPEDTL